MNNQGAEKMSEQNLLEQIKLGEDSSRQFKADIRNAESLAAEMAAMANSDGGTIFIGVADDGAISGLCSEDISRINQLIGNAASNLVRSPINVITKNISAPDGRIVILVSVPKGLNKPYFDKNGVIWFKAGADKRRINSREELQRLFQFTEQFHADETPTKAGVDRLDRLLFRDFLKEYYKINYPEHSEALIRLLQNMNLACENGHLNLAGVLLFAENPEFIKPQFVIKAIRYPGNQIHAKRYLDTEDFSGPIQRVFADAMAFIMRNLHKCQRGGSVNSPGKPEIPPEVFEELVVNALVHRDYFVSAPIRIFIYDNRIEIISPGHLPNNLTIEKIRTGNSNIRNPILVSFAAKGLLPYHGLGSGIKRSLEMWPDIELIDDREGCLFVARVFRKANLFQEIPATPYEISSNKNSEVSTIKQNPKKAVKTRELIIKLLRENPDRTIPEMALTLQLSTRAIEKQLARLQTEGRLMRQGARKNGRWVVI